MCCHGISRDNLPWMSNRIVYYLTGNVRLYSQCSRPNNAYRALHIPLPYGPGQANLPIGQVELNRVSFWVVYTYVICVEECKIVEVGLRQVKFFLSIKPWIYNKCMVCNDLKVDTYLALVSLVTMARSLISASSGPSRSTTVSQYTYGLEQGCSIPIADALEILQPSMKPYTCTCDIGDCFMWWKSKHN